MAIPATKNQYLNVMYVFVLWYHKNKSVNNVKIASSIGTSVHQFEKSHKINVMGDLDMAKVAAVTPKCSQKCWFFHFSTI